MTPALITELQQLVGPPNVFTDPRVIETFSRDAYYYSPVLKGILSDKRAQVVVAPRTLEQLRAVVQLAASQGLPITLRGSGTGNYGQCVPLQGGLVLALHHLGQILEFDREAGWLRVEPGVKLGLMERQAREAGWELRCYPSTWATATVGGFVSGGFGGVGSIAWGSLWDGFLRRLLVMDATPQAALSWQEGEALNGFIHAYGTSGILAGLEVSLVPAVDWEEQVLVFDALPQALQAAYQLAQSTAIPTRLISLSEWPIPSFFRPLVQAAGVANGKTHLLVEVAQPARAALLDLASGWGGQPTFYRPASGYHRSAFSLSDFSWNHVTLWAMKHDPGWTYLQTFFATQPQQALAQIDQLRAAEGEQVAFHLEYIRMGGGLRLTGLDLVYTRDSDYLAQTMARREALGVEVVDPHTYYLDHDPRWGGEPVLAARLRHDPLGLLNPGKIARIEALV